MPLKLKAAVLLMAAYCLLTIAGCAIDPMEQLVIDIQSQDITKRKQAVIAMANLNDQRATEKLLNLLEKDDELLDVISVALVKKGREMEQRNLQINTVVEAVGKTLSNAHIAEPFRARAAWIIGEIGSRQGVSVLLTGTLAKVGVAPAAYVREYSRQALEKLGYYSEGREYEIPMGSLVGQVDVFPEPDPLALPDDD
jgi:HEAT repeat protein